MGGQRMQSLQGWLDQRLVYAVKLAEEDGLLNAATPNGILASGVPLSAGFTPPATPTGLDVLAGAILPTARHGRLRVTG